MSRLKKKLAASKNIEELNFQQFCEKTKLSALEFQTVVKGLLKSFFTVNNKAFIDILTNTYKLLLIQNIDLSDEEVNQACAETVTLRYLFMLNKLDKKSQLKFFNQLLHDINDNFSIQDLDSQLITDLKTYFYTQDSIFNIESIVLSLVNTIHINDDDIAAISAALDELDDSTVQVIGISISAALSQRDINIETSLNNIFKQINVDPQVLNNIKDLIDPTEVIMRNVTEQTPSAQDDPSLTEENGSADSSMIELFAGNPNVTEINGKYDLSDMRFSELINYYDDVDQQLAFRAIIPDLFTLSTINNVASLLFKSIYKSTNGLCDTAEDVTKYFLGYKNRGNQILKFFVVATQAEKLVPPTFLHRFLFALDHNVNSLITFADDSTFVKTFSDYLTMSHLRDEYAETVDHLLQDFASKNDLLALYQKAKQELNNPETAIPPNAVTSSTLKEEETLPSNDNNESVTDETGESSDDSSSQPDEEEADYSDLDINSIIELVPDENITRTIQVFVESLFNKSNNSKLLKELCTKIYSNAREKNLTVTDETLPVLIKAYPADQIFNLLLSFQNVSEYLPETTFRNIFTMLDEHFATFKCDVKSNLNKTLLQYIISATSRYEDVVAEKMQQICDNNNILEIYNKVADEYDKSIAKKDGKELEKDIASPLQQSPIAEEDDPLSEKDLPDWNFLEMSAWVKPGKSGEQAINSFIKSLCTKQNVNKLIEGVCLRLYQLSLQDKKIADNETSLLNSFKTYPVDQILKLLLSFHNINEYLPEKAFISLLTDCGVPMKKCPIQCTLNKTFLQYMIQTTTIYQENIKQIVETICKENDIVKVYNKVVKKQSTKDDKQDNNLTPIKSDDDTSLPKAPRFKHKSPSNPEQQISQNPSSPPKSVILEEEQQPSVEQQSPVHQIKLSPPVQGDNQPIKVDTTNVDDVTKKLVDDSVTPDVVICDNLSIRDFLNIVNQKYNVPYAKFIHDVTSYTIYALDQLNVINIDSVTKSFNEVLDLYKNDQLKRIVFSSLLKEFSKIPLRITSLDCPFITETLDYIQGDKRYTAYLRTTIDIMCEAYNKKHKSNIVNPFTDDVSKIKNRDLSLEETKQLLTIDQAKDNDDQIKDEVLFNFADFFNHEKIIILRDDVITSTTASSYQDVLNDYIKDNPDVDMPEAFATGVVANGCIFLTSYGKLDKSEVLQAIRRYYPSYSKIYFKEGTRNFTMSAERIAKVNRLFKKI